jgi:hypothetical protein
MTEYHSTTTSVWPRCRLLAMRVGCTFARLTSLPSVAHLGYLPAFTPPGKEKETQCDGIFDKFTFWLGKTERGGVVEGSEFTSTAGVLWGPRMCSRCACEPGATGCALCRCAAVLPTDACQRAACTGIVWLEGIAIRTKAVCKQGEIFRVEFLATSPD